VIRPFILVLLLTSSLISFAQNPGKQEEKNSPKEEKTNKLDRSLDYDYKVEKKQEVTINGKKVPYNVIAATLPVWDDEGKVIAGVFYTYYERSHILDKSSRPLVFSFNGGPGTPSVWMMLGYTGPRLLQIDDEGYPVQPYGLRDNQNSILDIADIVYVDPVNTGFSRPLAKDYPKDKFFGVNADVRYLGNWINTFVNKYQRWASPKYLIGESYGTTRVSGLALELQNSHWMYLNGVILVSPTDLGIKREGPVDNALMLPYYAATAWYHKALSPELQSKDLNALLPEVEKFTIDEYIPALTLGSSIDPDRLKNLVEKVSKYSGLKSSVIKDNNGIIQVNFFWKELLRDKGYTVGRLDSRYLGIDSRDAGNGPEYNAELTNWLHAFTPAINLYLRDELGYKTNLDYNMFGPVHPWNNDGNNTGYNLRAAMAQNPFLHVLVQSGYYDGACDYFNAKYNMWQLDPNGKLKNRIFWEGYRSGHMMYLRKEDLKTSNDHLRKFIMESIPAKGQPARYDK